MICPICDGTGSVDVEVYYDDERDTETRPCSAPSCVAIVERASA